MINKIINYILGEKEIEVVEIRYIFEPSYTFIAEEFGLEIEYGKFILSYS